MKSLVATFVTALVGAATTVGLAASGGGGVHDVLLLIGPVEAINSIHTRAVVLGQKNTNQPAKGVAVGNTVAVYGTESTNKTNTTTKKKTEKHKNPKTTTKNLGG